MKELTKGSEPDKFWVEQFCKTAHRRLSLFGAKSTGDKYVCNNHSMGEYRTLLRLLMPTLGTVCSKCQGEGY